MSESTNNESKAAPIGRVTWWGFGRRWYGTATGAVHDEGLGEYAVVDPDEPQAWGTRLVLLSHVHHVGEGGALMAGELDAIEQAARGDLMVRPIDIANRACAVFECRADEALRLVNEVRSLRDRDAERNAKALRALADAGDPVARAFVHAPIVDGKPDADEPRIDDAPHEEWIPHEVILQRLLEQAKADCEALAAEIARLRERETQLAAERDEARAWVRRITAAERVLTCVYCGEAYPPGTPDHGAETLTAHVRVCAQHPMREAESEIERLRERETTLTQERSEQHAGVRVLRETLRRMTAHLEVEGRAGDGISETAWDDYHAARMLIGRADAGWDDAAAGRGIESIRRETLGVDDGGAPR